MSALNSAGVSLRTTSGPFWIGPERQMMRMSRMFSRPLSAVARSMPRVKPWLSSPMPEAQVTPRIVLPPEHRDDRLLMPAGEAGAAEEAFRRDAGGAQRGARDEVARGAVRIRPGHGLAAHLLEARDPGIGADVHHGDVAGAAIGFLRHQEGLDIAVRFHPGGGVGGGRHARHLDMAAGEGLHDAGVVSRLEQADRHAEGLLDQAAIGAVAADAVGLVLAAEDADADLPELLRPGPPAALRHGMLGRRLRAGGEGREQRGGEDRAAQDRHEEGLRRPWGEAATLPWRIGDFTRGGPRP
jgi:hypothetical protein